MKTLSLIFIFVLGSFALTAFAQESNIPAENKTIQKSNLRLKDREPRNNWGLNLTFSDNGFGVGATKFFPVSKDVSLYAGVTFSGAKDDREFEQYDIWGNSITPYKENRLFMFPLVNLGMQIRLFREDVTDNMRPFITFGAAPTAIVYTPYNESFFASFKHAQAKYTVGAYAGVGLDYVSNKTSSLSFNVRYYYISLFGEGIRSISQYEKKQFGGIYFVFSYNFMTK